MNLKQITIGSILMLIGVACTGTPIIQGFDAYAAGDWLVGDYYSGIPNQNDGAAVDTVEAYGGRPDVLKLALVSPASLYEDVIGQKNGVVTPNLRGNYASLTGFGTLTGPVRGIHFDFYVDPNNAESLPVAALGIYLYGGGVGTEETWYWDNIGAAGYEWDTYGANIDALGTGWTSTGSDWAGTIANVLEVGIVLRYLGPSAGTQIYAIDDFTISEDPFLVPEPETYAFLAMAILALGLVFRKQVDESLRSAFANVRV